MWNAIYAIYYWSTGLQQYEILKLVMIKKSCLQSLKNKLIVQVDETMLNHKVKAHRGRTPGYQYWAFITHIENKFTETIIPIIKNVIRPESIIHTDEVKVYKQLGKDATYQHQSVIHKYEFVNYETGTHTRHIESLNNRLKKVLKEMHGCQMDKRENFILKFVWRNNEKEPCSIRTINSIKLKESSCLIKEAKEAFNWIKINVFN